MAQWRDIAPGIAVDPEIAHGKPIIAGTRIPAALILGQLTAGVTCEELEREYGLQKQQVLNALLYAQNVYYRLRLGAWRLRGLWSAVPVLRLFRVERLFQSDLAEFCILP